MKTDIYGTKKPAYWDKAVKELCQKDKKLSPIITKFSNVVLFSRGDSFNTLCRAIIGQQISVKAADSVWDKMVSKLKFIRYQCIIDASEKQLKDFGLSTQKSRYLKNIAYFYKENKIDGEAFWHSKEIDEVEKTLIQIKGVGKWTFEMFAIFYLNHPNIFPIADIGLIRAIQQLYGKNEKVGKEDILKIAERWEPWKTVATWYLWRSIDPNLITY